MKIVLLLCAVSCGVASCASQDKMAWPVATASAPRIDTQSVEQEAPPPRVADDLGDDRASLCAAGAIDCTEDPTASLTPPATTEKLHFAWPLEARAITSGFGMRTDPIEPEQTRFHRGLDLAATYGAMVRASAAGMVTDGRWAGGYGRHISINHGHGWVTSYSHLSLLLVVPGTWVEQGDPIGLVGESGRATGPHLHFEIVTPRGVVNPLRLLGTPPDSLAVR